MFVIKGLLCTHMFTGRSNNNNKKKKKQLEIAHILSFVIGGYVYFSDSILLTWYCLFFFFTSVFVMCSVKIIIVFLANTMMKQYCFSVNAQCIVSMHDVSTLILQYFFIIGC